ncbi:hypothetical protein [Paenibacillus sp. 2TAB19]|uniref:hypothetical protein n=1 Tax=Paenibacillus sp. 2TAB19 TaxID=3233003 RepID=UPI003F998D35
MLFWFILGGLFLGGGAYVMIHGVKLVQEDNELQEKIAEAVKRKGQEESLS